VKTVKPRQKNIQNTNFSKIITDTVEWQFDELEKDLNEVIEMLNIIHNRTRRTMLLSLYQQPREVSFFRENDINPKLIYENLKLFRRSNIIKEASEGTYELTEIGKRIFQDYLDFLEKMKKLLEEKNDYPYM
jgi:predicted transcriptional regulator